MQRLPALITVMVVLSALTACSGGSEPGTTPAGCVPSGDASALVEATGDFGEAPEVTFPTPLVTDTVEKTELLPGSSAPLRDGQPVILEATILSGADGSVLQQTAYSAEGGSLFTVGDQQLPALGEALECATIGSRIAIAASPDESSSGGAPVPDSVVYVVDVLDAFHSQADGIDVQPVSGMPTVVSAPDGTPGITIPGEDAPTDYRRELLRKGDGAEIGADDAVVVKVTAVDWEDRTVSSNPASTWETGSSTIFFLGQDDATLGPGLVQTIVGQRTGSRVLAVVPPGLAGGDGQTAPSESTLVYVIDILGTVDL